MNLKSQFIQVLRNGDTKRIRFSLKASTGANVSLGTDDFADIAKKIEGGTIKVAKGDLPYGVAKYEPPDKAFYVGNGPTWSRLFDTLIVHESVHAIFHGRKLKIATLDDEAAAYIAMRYYLRNSGYAESRLDDSDLSYWGFKAAQEMVKDPTDGTWLTTLRDEIKASPFYSTSFGRDSGYSS